MFGNSVAIATFDERADTLTFTSTATVEHNPAEEFALTPDDPAFFYPFLYDDEEYPDLVQFVTPQYADPDGELSAWPHSRSTITIRRSPPNRQRKCVPISQRAD